MQVPLSSTRASLGETADADPTLAAMFEQCRRGEADSFGPIYHRFVRVVHGIVLAGVGPAEAEDLTQEVFMKVHRGISTVRDSEALPGWICTVARNAVTDLVRHHQRRPRHLHLVEEPAEEAPMEDRELGERVLALIRGLPESYRETLVLRLVEGLTGPEIAARTGMTHGSVRVNLSRGMSQLRPLLEKEGWS